MSTSRVGFRFFQNTRTAFRNAYAPFRRPGAQGRRFQSSEAGDAAQHQNPFQRLWSSPIGIRTVHFWYVTLFGPGIGVEGAVHGNGC